MARMRAIMHECGSGTSSPAFRRFSQAFHGAGIAVSRSLLALTFYGIRSSDSIPTTSTWRANLAKSETLSVTSVSMP